MEKILFLAIFVLLACNPQRQVVVEKSGVPDRLPEEEAPPLKDPVPGFIRFDEQEEVMLQATNELPSFEQTQVRFISCADQFNGVGIDSVKTCRDGVVKALHSISLDVGLPEVREIGPAQSIIQIRLKDFGLTPSKWKAIERADPFKFTSQTVRGRTLQFLTKTERPMINGNIFAESALVKAYYEVLGIPASFAEFEKLLGTDIQKDFDERDADLNLWGMNESVITANRQHRLILRVKGRFGPLWCTFDTNDQAIAAVNIDGVLVNQKNLPEAPFPPQARSKRTFIDNAGECIFVKANGFLGMALYDVAGVRQDFAPTNIVQDTASASRGLSGTIQNARSCYRCHAAGFIPVKDSIGPHIAANTTFNADDKVKGRLFFKSASVGDAMFRKDNAAYLAALSEAGIDNPAEDSINNLIDGLRLEQDLDQVAGMLGYPPEEIEVGLRASSAASAVLGALLQPNGKVNLQQLIDGLPLLARDMNLFKDDE